MKAMKGVKKLEKRIEDATMTFLRYDVNCKLAADFEADFDAETLFFSPLVISSDIYWWDWIEQEFGYRFETIEEVWAFSFLHEIGHFETDDEWEDEDEYKDFQEQKKALNSIEDDRLRNNTYFAIGMERRATEWGIEWVKAHTEDFKAFTKAAKYAVRQWVIKNCGKEAEE